MNRETLASAAHSLLVTREEWAALRGVKPRAVAQWAARYDDFPAPIIGPPRLDRATMYYRGDVDAFHERHPRLARR